MKKPDVTTEMLEKKGITVAELERLLRARSPQLKLVKPYKTSRYKLGVISDTHLVDKGSDLGALKNFYERCAREGIADIVHAGDIVHGMNVYKGQLNDLLCYGFDDHLNFVADNYPKIGGITTHFIGGNHCESYEIAGGGSFGKRLSQERSDMNYLGLYDATVILNGVKFELHHGAKGVPYSVSYHLQKYIEKLESGKKPQFYILGHYHCALYMLYRNIHCFLPGCFQRPNNFSVRMGFPNLICGWIVDMEVLDDHQHTVRAVKAEMVAYP